MGRIALVLPEQLLKDTIQEAEKNNKFENRTQLYQYVVDKLKTCKDEKGNEKSLTVSVIDNRVRQFKIELKTPKGKVGEFLSGVRPKKEDSFKKRKDFQTWQKAIEKKFAEKPKMAKKICKGSIQAIIKANCFECSGFDTKEAARCELVHCVFYQLNPYINHAERDEDGKLKPEFRKKVKEIEEKDEPEETEEKE